jgi:hypothetical protein
VARSRYLIPLDPAIAQWADQLDDDAREFFEERSAVYEHEAGLPRLQAEAEARIAVERYLTQRTAGPNTGVLPPKDRK